MTADPVAFGLRALKVALCAKRGRRVTANEIVSLAELHNLTIKDDAEAALAVMRFAARAFADPRGAGSELMNFLTSWRDGVLSDDAAATEAKLDHMAPVDHAPKNAEPPPMPPLEPPPEAQRKTSEKPKLHDWQTRADTGFD